MNRSDDLERAIHDSDVLELAIDLIRRRSVTPEDAGCLTHIGERLAGAGFRVEHLRYG